MEEMEELLSACPLTVKAGLAEKEGKACVLTQAYISGTPLKSAALNSDCSFIAQVKIYLSIYIYIYEIGRASCRERV